MAAELAGMPHETAMSPGGIIAGTAVPYTFANVKTVAHRLVTTPLRPSWIRSPGRMQSGFAHEVRSSTRSPSQPSALTRLNCAGAISPMMHARSRCSNAWHGLRVGRSAAPTEMRAAARPGGGGWRSVRRR